MITFNDIKKNNELYYKTNAYVDAKKEISSDLKEKMKCVIEKYRHYFCVLEENNIIEFIDKSIEKSDIRILKNSLHSIGGCSYNYNGSRDYYDVNDKDDIREDDDEYNLD